MDGKEIGEVGKKILPIILILLALVLITPAQATVTSDFYKTEIYKGPFKPGTTQTLAENTIINNGDEQGVVYGEFAELNSDGSVKEVICRTKHHTEVGPGTCVCLEAAPWICSMPIFPQCGTTKKLQRKLPEELGTYYYGMKTWGEDEPEPTYSAPPASSDNVVTWKVVVQEPPEPVVGFQVTGVQAVTATAGAAAIAGLALYYVRYLR